jgi:hypothetical protein
MGIGRVLGVMLEGDVMRGPAVKGLLTGLGAEKMLLLAGLATAPIPAKIGLSDEAGLWLLIKSCIFSVLAGGLKKGLFALRGV